jgi:hypothetical protein
LELFGLVLRFFHSHSIHNLSSGSLFSVILYPEAEAPNQKPDLRPQAKIRFPSTTISISTRSLASLRKSMRV